jgi:hypothetical protein
LSDLRASGKMASWNPRAEVAGGEGHRSVAGRRGREKNAGRPTETCADRVREKTRPRRRERRFFCGNGRSRDAGTARMKIVVE